MFCNSFFPGWRIENQLSPWNGQTRSKSGEGEDKIDDPQIRMILKISNDSFYCTFTFRNTSSRYWKLMRELVKMANLSMPSINWPTTNVVGSGLAKKNFVRKWSSSTGKAILRHQLPAIPRNLTLSCSRTKSFTSECIKSIIKSICKNSSLPIFSNRKTIMTK